MGTFGAMTVSVPRARLEGADSNGDNQSNDGRSAGI
jgi:hypothetical protein